MLKPGGRLRNQPPGMFFLLIVERAAFDHATFKLYLYTLPLNSISTRYLYTLPLNSTFAR